MCWLYGQGVVESSSESIKWWKRAADGGNIQAQYKMGSLYEDGNGVDMDVLEAIRYFRKAATGGSAEAALKLGKCIDMGITSRRT